MARRNRKIFTKATRSTRSAMKVDQSAVKRRAKKTTIPGMKTNTKEAKRTPKLRTIPQIGKRNPASVPEAQVKLGTT